ncbi:hypothetical protein [Chromobacterium sp. CV08]|uniref:hypothetical protein n=1 Tax=Chromobacterium sp. CV08 TaxID=3133274 RepID=UPI003DA805C2
MENKVIIGDVNLFAIKIEPLDVVGNLIYGSVDIFIEGDSVLRVKYNDYTINSIVAELKCNFRSELSVRDLGKVCVKEIDFHALSEDRVVYIPTGELWDCGLSLYLGFDGAEERLFYSNDFEETIFEKRLPKGTTQKVILSIPDYGKKLG